MKSLTTTDSETLAWKWMRRAGVLCLLACLPLGGCNKDEVDEDKKSSDSSKDDDDEDKESTDGDSEDDNGDDESDNEDSGNDDSDGSDKKDPDEDDDGSDKGDDGKGDDDKGDDGKGDDDKGDDGKGDDDKGDDGKGDDDKGDDGKGDDGKGDDDKGDDGKGDDDKGDPEPEKEVRDCDKISWGSPGTKVGQVVARRDVKGYVDSDGDEKVETTQAPAGMCELHMMDKKRCGLVVYGAGRRTGGG